MTNNNSDNSSTQNPEFPAANRPQALHQLELLGYKPSDQIYLRFFYPNDDPRKNSDKGRKANYLNWQQIETYQRQGRGVYFVVNGGGHKDEDVTVGRAIFCEHDHLDKDIQRNLWQTLNLPEPTFQVDTGGKSIHSYWVFVEAIAVEKWRELQKDLLEYVDGDRSIKNPSRVMRLAGCWHITHNQGNTITNPTRIISESGSTYSYTQLRNLIPPPATSSRTTPYARTTANSGKEAAEIRQNGRKPPLITDNRSLITDEVPLYQFLTLDDRALIDGGSANGTRNSMGAKLARNLIGTSARLNYLGIPFTEEPYQLFLDYCNRCPSGDGWNEREWENIWKSAGLNNPTPSLTDEVLINCAIAWQKKLVNNLTNGHNNGQKSSPSPTNNGHNNGKNSATTTSHGQNNKQKSLVDLEIADVIDELINLELSPSKLTAKLNEIAQITHIPISEVRKLYTEQKSEIEQVDSRESTKDELEQLRHATSTSLDLSTVIPEALAEPIKKLANWLNLRPECYLISLLTGISTLNDTETELVLHRDWDFTVSPNLFGSIVSPSSQKKSPILKAMVTKPLRQLQSVARKEYKEAMKQYEIDLARYEELKRNKNTEALNAQFPQGRPIEPRMKLYYFTNATGEGIINQVAAHPNQGILYLKDELAGVFKSANQYRGGRGSDEEDLLSYYDGTGGTVLRANGMQADLDGLLLGILGSIQPGVLQKLLGDFEDSNGNWARFMFVWQPLAASSMSTDGGKFDLTELIAWLYEELDRTSELAPKKYALTPDAFQLFSEAYNELEQRRVDPNTSPAMQNVWGKSEGRIGKIAINLHRTEAAFKGEIPSELIERHTIKAAIALTYFSAQQIQAIYTMLGGEDSLPPMLAKVLEIAERKGDWITARDVQFGFNSKKRPKAETIRQWFKELEALELGKIEGTGRQIKFWLSDNCGLCGQMWNRESTTPTQAQQGFQPIVDIVDNSKGVRKKIEEDNSLMGIQTSTNCGHPKDSELLNPMASNSGSAEIPSIREKPSADCPLPSASLPKTDNNQKENKKTKKLSTKSTNCHNVDTELDTDVDRGIHNSPQSPQTVHPIKKGSQVKIHWAGSMRDGEVGTVLSIDESGWATVRLHNKSLRRDLQIASVPIAKTPGQEYYLELIE